MSIDETTVPDVETGPAPEPPFGFGFPKSSRRPVSWVRRLLLVVALVVAIATIAGFVIRVPYTTIAPGEALSLPPRVTITGAPSYTGDRGDIRLLFVREAGHVNLWQYVRARLDSNIELVKDSAVNPGKLTPRQQNEQGLQQMADAKAAATAVALRTAGYRVGVAPGLIVNDLVPDYPAIKVLDWGDVILTADGRKIAKAEDLTAAISGHARGQDVVLGITRAGKHMDVRVPVTTTNGRKLIGVTVSPRLTFPFQVKVDTTGIGGPSAGLAMSLAILDDLTPGDLTGGKHVAVTGTIDPAGKVGEIGGIQQKAVAARAAHVSLFIVPQCSPDDPPAALTQCKDDLVKTAKRAGSSIKVVPVSTLAQALKVLRDNGGAPVSTTVPATPTTVAAS
ncbi:MAG: Lon-like protease [Actinomycetota bacterium]|nr:Lon-like protease [Actinomycetota bacterium]